jgi:hypothetical protein
LLNTTAALHRAIGPNIGPKRTYTNSFLRKPEHLQHARYRNRLFMAAGHSLDALYVNTQGAPGG